MKITETKVKTLYTIEFGSSEFTAIATHYLHTSNKHKYPRAFENIALTDDIKIADLDNFFKMIGIEGNNDLFNYIANYFGFDGWENAGYYNENRRCYRMTVFNYGDTLSE